MKKRNIFLKLAILNKQLNKNKKLVGLQLKLWKRKLAQVVNDKFKQFLELAIYRLKIKKH